MQTGIGKYKYPVVWETPAGPAQARNPQTKQLIPDWQPLGTVHVRIIANKSIEKLAEQPQGQSTYMIEQRYMSTLDMSCRMLFRGKIYKITGLLNVDEANLYQLITVVCSGVIS